MSQKKRKRNKANQDGPPTLADIVRQETGDGRVIVKFYRDVIQGKLDDEGFEACHKLEAAMQVHAIAPEVVADAITRLTGIECHPERRTKRPNGTNRRSRAVGTCPVHDTGNPSPDAGRHQALDYLAHALAAPSLADDPRVTGIVRESTDHGKTVVSFLLHVMHGVVRGFRPRQRVDAANELIGHIARDELARSGSLPVIPAEAGIQKGGDRAGLPSAAVSTEPVLSAPKSSFPRRREPIPGPAATEGPVLSKVEGTKIVRPELVEDSALSSPKGQRPGNSVVPGSGPASNEADLPVIPADAGIQDGGDEDDTGDDQEDQRGTYDIDQKIAEAQHDPAHPIHKFVQAYDEVAAAFHANDKDNDNDDEVRYWISGEVRDADGKYIWEYAPADPRSYRRLRPKRRRRSRPKGESVWVKSEIDKRREAGIPPPKRTLIWV